MATAGHLNCQPRWEIRFRGDARSPPQLPSRPGELKPRGSAVAISPKGCAFRARAEGRFREFGTRDRIDLSGRTAGRLRPRFTTTAADLSLQGPQCNRGRKRSKVPCAPWLPQGRKTPSGQSRGIRSRLTSSTRTVPGPAVKAPLADSAAVVCGPKR